MCVVACFLVNVRAIVSVSVCAFVCTYVQEQISLLLPFSFFLSVMLFPSLMLFVSLCLNSVCLSLFLSFSLSLCATQLGCFPVTNSRLKCSHYENSGVYLIIFFISKKIFQYESDFGWFLAITGVLGHFEAKKCANWLNFFPDFKFKYKTALQFKN